MFAFGIHLCGESGNSLLEQRTLNRDRFESPLHQFEAWAFLFSPRCPSSRSYINEYLAIDGGGKCE